MNNKKSPPAAWLHNGAVEAAGAFNDRIDHVALLKTPPLHLLHPSLLPNPAQHLPHHMNPAKIHIRLKHKIIPSK